MEQELLKAALEGLEMRRETLNAQIAEVRRMLGGRDVSSPDGTGPAASTAPVRKRSKMSAAGRLRIAEAQRKRWAAAKGQAAVPAKKAAPATGAATKRRISPEGMKRIVAAAKKRWAAVRAAKKAAAAKRS